MVVVSIIIADFAIILTGIIGSGKSSFGNFFMKKKVFAAKWSLKPVTTAPASCTSTIAGKCITMIDTPGFSDPSLLKLDEEFTKAIIDIPNTIHAICLVINIRNRFTSNEIRLLDKLLTMEETIPYVFLVFTHAKLLGNTDEEQRKAIENLLRNTQNCPKVVQSILRKINNRFMLLECVEPMKEEGYYDKKSHELLLILQGIKDQNKKPLTCSWNHISKLYDVAEEEYKEKLEEVMKDLETELSKIRANETRRFYSNLIYTARVMSASSIRAGIQFSSTITSGISETARAVYQYFTNSYN